MKFSILNFNFKVQQQFALGLIMMLMVSFCGGFTHPDDGNTLYI